MVDEDTLELTEADRVRQWQEVQMLRLLPDNVPVAEKLLDEGVDYHDVARALEDGCPVGLLAAVLA